MIVGYLVFFCYWISYFLSYVRVFAGFFFFQAEDGIRDLTVLEFRRVLFRSHRSPGDPLTRAAAWDRGRSAALYGGGRTVHGRHDRSPRAGGVDGRLGTLARCESGGSRPVRAHRGRPKRRDRVRAALVARAQRVPAAGRPTRPRDARN